MKRRWLAPEVIQTSAMDCGPAVLKSALEGFGVPVHLGHLREACQTGVDGTSINTLEDLARELGLRPVQTLIPRDHLRELLPLPAVLVLARADRSAHFVLLWRAVGEWVQLMDPGRGRVWMRWEALYPLLLDHHHAVDEDTRLRWLASDLFLEGLRRRLVRLTGRAEPEALYGESEEELVALDAATRSAESLVRAGALRPGPEGESFALALRGRLLSDPGFVSPASWSVLTQADGRRFVRGAVVLTLSPPDGAVAPSTPELRSALTSSSTDAWRGLLRGLARPDTVALAVGTAAFGALGGVAQAALLRALLDADRWLRTPQQRAVWALALVLLSGLLVVLGLAWTGALMRLGRLLELRLRLAFHQKLPRLGDRYFSSRQRSDLAERAHAITALRGLPSALSGVMAALAGLLTTLCAILWLDPSLWLWVGLTGAGAVALPMALQPLLASREMRRQTRDGALSRSYLDAMLGAVPLYAHAAEESMRRDHEGLLVSWRQSADEALHASVVAGAVQGVLGIALAGVMVRSHLDHATQAGAMLLLVYWATRVPAQGQSLATAMRALPALRVIGLRLLEPLDSPEEGGDEGARWPAGPLSVSLQGVEIRGGGASILQVESLEIAAGEHVAIVGRSGAGKSALLGLLLGHHRGEGALRVGGLPVEPGSLPGLRRRLAWVDPAVQLWNRSLLENLRYGQESAPLTTDAVLEQAELFEVLRDLPEGLASPLGDGGALLSGGQGQRVRLARALGRPDVGLALLDEPFRGLDADQRRRMLARARQRWADATMLFVSHDVGDTRAFARVLVIEGGRLVEDGAPDELAARGGVYAALLAEEQALRASLAERVDWRRWRVDGGRVLEEG